MKEKCRNMDNAYIERTTPTYSVASAALRVIAYALQVAHAQCGQILHTYCILRITLMSYIVVRREYLPTTSMVSGFALTRTVNITKGRTMTCSCEFYERHGIPCRHIYAILGEVSKSNNEYINYSYIIRGFVFFISDS